MGSRLLSQVRFWVIGLGLFFCLLGVLDGQDGDIAFYRPMFEGIFEGIKAPFASRVLYPLLISLFPLDVPLDALTWIATLLMSVGFLWILNEIFDELSFTPILKWVGLAGGYLPFTFTEPMMPDLIGMLLFALVILLWLREKTGWAVAAMFPLAMARESYLLFALILAALAWRSKFRWWGLASLAVFVVGMIAAAAITDSVGNRQGLSSGLYMILKVPLNFARNYLGFSIWTESLTDVINQKPATVYPLPSFLQLGNNQNIGIVEWHASIMVWTFASVLGLHGLAIPLLLRAKKSMRQTLRDSSWILRPLAAASVVTILLGPCLGASVSRLVGYGWPMASIIVPLMLMRLPAEQRDRLAVLHLAVLSLAATMMFGYQEWVAITRLFFGPLTILFVLLYVMPRIKKELDGALLASPAK